MRIVADVADVQSREVLAQGMCPVNAPCVIVFDDRYEAERVKKLLEVLLDREGE